MIAESESPVDICLNFSSKYTSNWINTYQNRLSAGAPGLSVFGVAGDLSPEHRSEIGPWNLKLRLATSQVPISREIENLKSTHERLIPR